MPKAKTSSQATVSKLVSGVAGRLAADFPSSATLAVRSCTPSSKWSKFLLSLGCKLRCGRTNTYIAAWINLHDHITTATPTVDYFIGLQFADQLCDLSFAVRCGWEQHVIFDTNRIFGNGNLSAQGLTLAWKSDSNPCSIAAL